MQRMMVRVDDRASSRTIAISTNVSNQCIRVEPIESEIPR